MKLTETQLRKTIREEILEARSPDPNDLLTGEMARAIELLGIEDLTNVKRDREVVKVIGTTSLPLDIDADYVKRFDSLMKIKVVSSKKLVLHFWNPDFH